ncbi:hypothetical protein ES703_119011 [subsurface metagenome]
MQAEHSFFIRGPHGLSEESFFILSHVIRSESDVDVFLWENKYLLPQLVLFRNMDHEELGTRTFLGFEHRVSPHVSQAVVCIVSFGDDEIANRIIGIVLSHLPADMVKGKGSEQMENLVQLIRGLGDKAFLVFRGTG